MGEQGQMKSGRRLTHLVRTRLVAAVGAVALVIGISLVSPLGASAGSLLSSLDMLVSRSVVPEDTTIETEDAAPIVEHAADNPDNVIGDDDGDDGDDPDDGDDEDVIEGDEGDDEDVIAGLTRNPADDDESTCTFDADADEYLDATGEPCTPDEEDVITCTFNTDAEEYLDATGEPCTPDEEDVIAGLTRNPANDDESTCTFDADAAEYLDATGEPCEPEDVKLLLGSLSLPVCEFDVTTLDEEDVTRDGEPLLRMPADEIIDAAARSVDIEVSADGEWLIPVTWLDDSVALEPKSDALGFKDVAPTDVVAGKAKADNAAADSVVSLPFSDLEISDLDATVLPEGYDFGEDADGDPCIQPPLLRLSAYTNTNAPSYSFTVNTMATAVTTLPTALALSSNVTSITSATQYCGGNYCLSDPSGGVGSGAAGTAGTNANRYAKWLPLWTDAVPGDGICSLETPLYDNSDPNNPVVTNMPTAGWTCTLQAALMEVNALGAMGLVTEASPAAISVQDGFQGQSFINGYHVTGQYGVYPYIDIPFPAEYYGNAQKMYPYWLPAPSGTQANGTAWPAAPRPTTTGGTATVTPYSAAGNFTTTTTYGWGGSMGQYNGWFATSKNPANDPSRLATCPITADTAIGNGSAGYAKGEFGAVFAVTAPVTIDFNGTATTSYGQLTYTGTTLNTPILPGVQDATLDGLETAIFALLGNGIEIKNISNIYGTETAFYVGPCAQNITLTDVNMQPPNYYPENFMTVRGGAGNITLQGTGQVIAPGDSTYIAGKSTSTLQGLEAYITNPANDGYVVINGANAANPVGPITINNVTFIGGTDLSTGSTTNCGAYTNTSQLPGTSGATSSSCNSPIFTNKGANGSGLNAYYTEINFTNNQVYGLNSSTAGGTDTTVRGIDLRRTQVAPVAGRDGSGAVTITGNQFIKPGYRAGVPVIDFGTYNATATSSNAANLNSFNITNNKFTGMTGFGDTTQTYAAAIMMGNTSPIPNGGVISGNIFQWGAVNATTHAITPSVGPNAIYWNGGQTATPASGTIVGSNLSIHDNDFNWQVGTNATTPSANAGIRLMGTGFVEMARNTFASGSASQVGGTTTTNPANLSTEETGNLIALLVDNMGTSASTTYPGTATANGELLTWYPTASSGATLGTLNTTGCAASLQLSAPTAVSGTRTPAMPSSVDLYWTAGNDAEVWLGNYALSPDSSAPPSPVAIDIDLPLPGSAFLTQWPNTSTMVDPDTGNTVPAGPVTQNGRVFGYLRVQTQDPSNGTSTPASSQYSRVVAIQGKGCVPTDLVATVSPLGGSGYQNTAIMTGTAPFSDGSAASTELGWLNEPNDCSGMTSMNCSGAYISGEDGSASNDLIRSNDLLSSTWNVNLSSNTQLTQQVSMDFTQTIILETPDWLNGSQPAVVNFASQMACSGGSSYITAYSTYNGPGDPGNVEIGIIQPATEPPAGTTAIVLDCPIKSLVGQTNLQSAPIWVSNTSTNRSNFSISASVAINPSQAVTSGPNPVQISAPATACAAIPGYPSWAPPDDPPACNPFGPFIVSAAPRWDLVKQTYQNADGTPVGYGMGGNPVGEPLAINTILTDFYGEGQTPVLEAYFPVYVQTDRKLGVEAIPNNSSLYFQDWLFASYLEGDIGVPGNTLTNFDWQIISCGPATDLIDPSAGLLVNMTNNYDSTGKYNGSALPTPTVANTVSAAAGTAACEVTAPDINEQPVVVSADDGSNLVNPRTGPNLDGNPGGAQFDTQTIYGITLSGIDFGGTYPTQTVQGIDLTSGPYYAAAFVIGVQIPLAQFYEATSAAEIPDGQASLNIYNQAGAWNPIGTDMAMNYALGYYGEPGYCPQFTQYAPTIQYTDVQLKALCYSGATSLTPGMTEYQILQTQYDPNSDNPMAQWPAGDGPNNINGPWSYPLTVGTFEKVFMDRSQPWTFSEVQLPGVLSPHDGNALVQPGQTHSAKLTLSNTSGYLAITGIEVCDVFDNTMVTMAPIYKQSNDGFTEPLVQLTGDGRLKSAFIQPLIHDPAATLAQNVALQGLFEYEFGYIQLPQGDDPILGMDVAANSGTPWTQSPYYDAVTGRWQGDWTNQKAASAPGANSIDCSNPNITWFDDADDWELSYGLPSIDAYGNTLSGLQGINVIKITQTPAAGPDGVSGTSDDWAWPGCTADTFNIPGVDTSVLCDGLPPATSIEFNMAFTQNTLFNGGPHTTPVANPGPYQPNWQGMTIPAGTVNANFGNVKSDQYQTDWLDATYVPNDGTTDNSGATYSVPGDAPTKFDNTMQGDRWTVTLANGEITVQTVATTFDGLNNADGVSGVDIVGTAVAGNPITYEVNAQVNSAFEYPCDGAPLPMCNAPLANVVITVNVPPGIVPDIEATNALNANATYWSNGTTQTPLPPVTVIGVPNANGTFTRTLQWDLGYVQPNNPNGPFTISPILIATDSSPVSTSYACPTAGQLCAVLTANIANPGMVPTPAMTDTHIINILTPTAVVVEKAVDHIRDPLNDQQNYTLTIQNNTPVSIQAPIFYDVIPFDGDASLLYSDGLSEAIDRPISNPSNFTGTNSLDAVPTVTVTTFVEASAPQCTLSAYTDQETCENNGGSWDPMPTLQTESYTTPLCTTASDGTCTDNGDVSAAEGGTGTVMGTFCYWTGHPDDMPISPGGNPEIPDEFADFPSTDQHPCGLPYIITLYDAANWSAEGVYSGTAFDSPYNPALDSNPVFDPDNGQPVGSRQYVDSLDRWVFNYWTPQFTDNYQITQDSAQNSVTISGNVPATWTSTDGTTQVSDPVPYSWGSDSNGQANGYTATATVVYPLENTYVSEPYCQINSAVFYDRPIACADNGGTWIDAAAITGNGQPLITGFKFVTALQGAYTDGAFTPVPACDTSDGLQVSPLQCGWLPTNQLMSVNYRLQQWGNSAGDDYVNRFIGYTPTIPAGDGSYAPIVSATTRVDVVSYALGDLMWLDANTSTQALDGVFTPGTADQPIAGASIEFWGVGPDSFAGTDDDAHICVLDNGRVALEYIHWGAGGDGVLGTPDDTILGNTGPDLIPGTADDDPTFCGGSVEVDSVTGLPVLDANGAQILVTDPVTGAAVGVDPDVAVNGGNAVTNSLGRWSVTGLGLGPTFLYPYCSDPSVTNPSPFDPANGEPDLSTANCFQDESTPAEARIKSTFVDGFYVLIPAGEVPSSFVPLPDTLSDTGECQAVQNDLATMVANSNGAFADILAAYESTFTYVSLPFPVALDFPNPDLNRNENLECNQDGVLRGGLVLDPEQLAAAGSCSVALPDGVNPTPTSCAAAGGEFSSSSSSSSSSLISYTNSDGSPVLDAMGQPGGIYADTAIVSGVLHLQPDWGYSEVGYCQVPVAPVGGLTTEQACVAAGGADAWVLVSSSIYFIDGGEPTDDAPADGSPEPVGIDDTFTNLSLDIALYQVYPPQLFDLPFAANIHGLYPYLLAGLAAVSLGTLTILALRRRPTTSAADTSAAE